MIRFQNVYYSAGQTPVLAGLSVHIALGETLVLVGRSGSGKTTALRLVNAMQFPSSGSVVVDGRDTREWAPVELRRKIGYVIQEVGLFPHRTVAENVGTVPRLLGWDPPRIEKRVDELLDEVGLAPDEFRARYPRSLSGGQRQRVGVARALAAEPRILLFDEPFGALDPITRREMQDLFLALHERHRVTSLFVTHDISEALRLGSRIGLLVNGKLETIGSRDEFLRSESSEVHLFLDAVPGTQALGSDGVGTGVA